MSMMFCEKCDALFDTDNDVDCPHCTEESITEPKTIEEMMDDDSADYNYDGQD